MGPEKETIGWVRKRGGPWVQNKAPYGACPMTRWPMKWSAESEDPLAHGTKSEDPGAEGWV